MSCFITPALAALALAACGGPSSTDTLQVSAALEQAAAVNQDLSLHVDVKAADGTAVDGAAVAVTPWMPAMNHASTKTPVVSAASGGGYGASPVFFQMAGSWEVRVEAQLPDGRTGAYTLAVEVQ